MTESQEPTDDQPTQSRQVRRSSHRRRHPAAGTRKVLVAGSVAATLGLTGVLWNAAQANTGSTETDDDSTSTSTTDDSSTSYDYDDDTTSSYDTDDDSSSTTDDSVDVSPSYEAPDTTSSAS
jgi:cytoskeletal protein RodZ